MSSHAPLEDIVHLLADAIDPVVLATGQKRQADVWLGRTPDYLPLLLAYSPRHAGA